MFERFKFSFTDAWHKGSSVLICYDEQEDITYCYYSAEYSFIFNHGDCKKFEGHDLVSKLEECNFRKWNNLYNPFVIDGVMWSLEYNDKNSLEESCDGFNAFPSEFEALLGVIKNCFPDFNCLEVFYDNKNYEITDRKGNVLRDPIIRNTTEKTRKLIKELCNYIEIFESKKEFGKWKPEQNTKDSYSSENHIKYIKEVQNFKKDLKNIADKCTNLNLYAVQDICIDELNEEEIMNLLDNKSALSLLMAYMQEDKDNDSYQLEAALKNGNIVRILKFLQKFNRFDEGPLPIHYLGKRPCFIKRLINRLK